MDLLAEMKRFWELKEKFAKEMEALRQKTESYQELTTEELKELPEEELLDAVRARTVKKVEDYGYSYQKTIAGILALSEAERVFYCVDCLDGEVNNGGLCQFFVNPSRAAAPFVSECLGVLGATEHKRLLDDFIQKHDIDVNDLTSFDCEDVNLFSEQCERFPFDEFDQAFYKMKSLLEYLEAFVKQNLEAF